MFGSYKESIEVIKTIQKENPRIILTAEIIIEALEKEWEQKEHEYSEHMAGRLEGAVNGND